MATNNVSELRNRALQDMSDCFESLGYGRISFYEGTAAQLIASGLVERSDLPSPKGPRLVRRESGGDFQMTSFRNGKIRLMISSHLVRQRDTGFVDFMAQTVGRAVLDIAAKH